MSASCSDELIQRWNRATTTRELLDCLSERGSERKFRLLACAAIRRLWPLALDVRTRTTIEWIERVVDGEAEYNATRVSIAYDAYTEARSLNHEPALANAAYCAALPSPPHDPRVMASTVLEDCRAACERNVHLGFDPVTEQKAHVSLIRCTFGNAFLEPGISFDGWRSWNGGTLVELAESFYRDRQSHVLPILADALEELGCADERILRHCREDETHARGCWVVDLLLGKS